jgi:predicted DNA-binding ribbon-helix-helix protein
MAAHVAERHSGGGDAATGGTSGRGGEGRGEAEGEAKGRTGQQGEAVSKRVASVVKKRSVRVGKHLTSLTLENEFWEGLKEIAQKQQLPLNTLITDINKHRRHANLSSVLRLFVLDHYARLAAAPAKPTRRGTHER